MIATSKEDFAEKLCKLARKALDLNLARAAVGLVVTLTGIYYVGIVSNNFSDYWIDEVGWKHLYLKPEQLRDDDVLKVKSFGIIYRNELDSLGITDKQIDSNNVDKKVQREIVDFYYHAKNRLWKDDIWRAYILYSQKIINISRVWCLNFFFLFVLALFRFPLCGVRFGLWMRENSKRQADRKPRFEVLCSLVVIVLAIAGYRVGGAVWQSSEGEIDSKIFGVYRSEFGAPSRIAKLIESNKCGYIPTEYALDEPLESSGVAAFNDHLFIVNDKDNTIYVANQRAPACPLKLIEVPKFGKDKAKFEDIAFHAESGYFYVIGAHYSKEPNHQKVYRFQLEGKDDSWKPVGSEQLAISAGILRHLSDKERVEGIAVTGSAKNPTLYVGIRSDKPGRFRILEFGLDQSERQFVLRCPPHQLSLSPTHSSDGFAYHLSGLAVSLDCELVVLATSEDKANKFHGNRVYTVDLRNFKLKSFTPEFALAQKAEGIAVWRTSKSEQRIAIVFDNDYEDTSQVSCLLIAKSLYSLCN